MQSQADRESFTRFFRDAEPKLRRALIAGYGGEAGREAAAAALEYAWEHWSRIRDMENPAGYTYRVGCTRAGRIVRSHPTFPAPLYPADQMPWVEPGLPRALERLTQNQRVAVMLVHGLDWTLTETAKFLSISPGSVNKHAERGLAKLRAAMEVQVDV
jgi:DNA-directed RNA polymerase specialized sigma24 family protein